MRFHLIPAAYVYLTRTSASGLEVLLQLRSGTGFMDGHWAAAAAGHVEKGESVFACACRETREELGVEIVEADLVPVTTLHRTGVGDPVDERVDFFFTCSRWTGEPRRVETAKTADLRWFPLSALPDPTVPHERHVLTRYGTGELHPIELSGF